MFATGMQENAMLGNALNQTAYELSRLSLLTAPWQWMLLIGVCLLVVGFVIFMYVIDSRELPRGLGVLLLVLRVVAFTGLLVLFLGPQKRSISVTVDESRVIALVDTSQSMDKVDPAPPGTGDGSSELVARRIEPVINTLAEGGIVKKLRQQHDVIVYSFAVDTRELDANLRILNPTIAPQQRETLSASDRAESLEDARRFALICGVLLLSSIVLGLGAGLLRGKRRELASWVFFGSVVLLVGACVTMAVGHLLHSDLSLAAIVGLEDPEADEERSPQEPRDGQGEGEGDEKTRWALEDWRKALSPEGEETRLGTALTQLVNQERGGSLAAIVVFSDGGINTGKPYGDAVRVAQEAGIRVHTVGLGPITAPPNVGIVSVDAPPEVTAGVPFTIKADIMAYHKEGQPVTAAPKFAAEGTPTAAATEAGDAQNLRLLKDGQAQRVSFVVRQETPGTYNYGVKLEGIGQDSRPDDNQRFVTVKVTSKKKRVLLLAGGPTREFRFIRNQFYRNEFITSDVLLQTALPGTSQESNELLKEFPKTRKELSEYDCILAFDPDWRKLTLQQIKNIDEWVREEAGGLIIVAGPIYTREWTIVRPGNEKIDLVRKIYPVVFNRDRSNVKRDIPLEPEFTRAGKSARFLMLTTDPAEVNQAAGDPSRLAQLKIASQAAWEQFEGIYGYYAVKEAKRAAQVYAYLKDPDATLSGDKPIHLVGHSYARGRVFFVASGEMWRIRAVDDRYFKVFYTNLVNYVAEPHSRRGRMWFNPLVATRGDVVEAHAELYDDGGQGLTDETVDVTLIMPDGTRRPLELKRVEAPGLEGKFEGSFKTEFAGRYRLEYASRRLLADEALTSEQELRVEVPKLERGQLLRNERVLRAIARGTKGNYFASIDDIHDEQTGLARLIEPNSQERQLAGPRDDNFDFLLKSWLLAC